MIANVTAEIRIAQEDLLLTAGATSRDTTEAVRRVTDSDVNIPGTPTWATDKIVSELADRLSESVEAVGNFKVVAEMISEIEAASHTQIANNPRPSILVTDEVLFSFIDQFYARAEVANTAGDRVTAKKFEGASLALQSAMLFMLVEMTHAVVDLHAQSRDPTDEIDPVTDKPAR